MSHLLSFSSPVIGRVHEGCRRAKRVKLQSRIETCCLEYWIFKFSSSCTPPFHAVITYLFFFSQADNQGILGRMQEFLKGGGGPFSSLPLFSSPFPSLPFPSALFPAVPSLPSLSSLPFPLEVGPL